MEPMGRKEIDEKIAKRELSKDRWEFISHIVRLFAFWPALIAFTANIIVTTHGILVQEMSNETKMIWIISQNWPIIFSWVIIYYCLRRSHKFLGW